MTLLPLISKLSTTGKVISAYWKGISMVIGICGSVFAGVTWYANKQIEKYRQQQEQVMSKEQLQQLEKKIDNIIESDSLKTVQLNRIEGAVTHNTAETKATMTAVTDHFTKDKLWEEVIKLQQNLLDELKRLQENPPPVSTKIEKIKK